MDNALSNIANEALRYLGYSQQQLSGEFVNSVKELEQEMKRVCSARKIIAYYTPVFSNGEISLENTGITLRGRDIYKHLSGAKGAAVILCTLGAGFDSALMRMESISMTDAAVFNALGSAYIESIAQECEDEVTRTAMSKYSCYTNYRFSPGYGDFPIDTSAALLEACSAGKRIGLTITENSILIPRKSVTAVMGLFEKSVSTCEHSACDICTLRENCVRRKEGSYCGRRK